MTTKILLAALFTLACGQPQPESKSQPENPVVHWPCTRAEAIALCSVGGYYGTAGGRYSDAWHIATMLSNDTFRPENQQ